MRAQGAVLRGAGSRSSGESPGIRCRRASSNGTTFALQVGVASAEASGRVAISLESSCESELSSVRVPIDARTGESAALTICTSGGSGTYSVVAGPLAWVGEPDSVPQLREDFIVSPRPAAVSAQGEFLSPVGEGPSFPAEVTPTAEDCEGDPIPGTQLDIAPVGDNYRLATAPPLLTNESGEATANIEVTELGTIELADGRQETFVHLATELLELAPGCTGFTTLRLDNP